VVTMADVFQKNNYKTIAIRHLVSSSSSNKIKWVLAGGILFSYR
jgi:hypothetical protein